jgi:hypothetical protein
MSCTLDLLLGDVPRVELSWYQNASKLIHALLEDFENHPFSFHRGFLDQAYRFCFLLLAEHGDTLGEDEARYNSVAILMRLITSPPVWFSNMPPPPNNPAQFDLLVDYHVRTCQGTDYRTIKSTFTMLQWLRSSPSTPDRQHHYVNTIIRFMGQRITRDEAMRAACAIQSTVALIGRDDESLRERFSEGLASTVWSHATQTLLDDNSNSKSLDRKRMYLSLLHTLSKEPTWQPQLHLNGHFHHCRAIADSRMDASSTDYDVALAHIFAIIDASGEEHPFFTTVQVYSSWPLILRAWSYMFDEYSFEEATEDGWMLASLRYLEILPSIVAHARRHCDHGREPVIGLVEQVCRKLEDERRQREQGDAQYIQDSSFGYRGIPALVIRIRILVDALQRDDVWRIGCTHTDTFLLSCLNL